ncbi:MAG: histidine--tRNA ligase [Gammaproteobacteria bacterium]|nr:MAG: histidine--tRNA ligase [Gammaproteobacteria bacterium]TDJ43171.1 MAG: histidine--tRNA ligase [Gammaproteobacteria bacterium]
MAGPPIVNFQSVRGMRDQVPEAARRWSHVETGFKQVLASFSYEEIRLPLLESTALFSRSVGENTDIVQKEMYSLRDRDGESITLRPEGTAGCVRAGLQQGLLFNQVQRFWYAGPMFRYERPQKGRYRQFEQIGAEAFGMAGADLDAELLQLCADAFQRLGVADHLTLELNTLGTAASRQAYRDALVAYLEPRQAQLDEDSQRRLARNPLRILDSKDEGTQDLLAEAPGLEDFLDDESKAHFDDLLTLLEQLDIGYRVNTRLVRGLDYYTHTVFEWVTDALGAQGTVCAGGRYDGLVEQLGGRPSPAAGFALGVDRLVLLHEVVFPDWQSPAVDAYCVVLGPAQRAWAMALCQRLRLDLPALKLRLHNGGGKLKNQLRRADQSGAVCALLIGEDEVNDNRVTLKWLLSAQSQERLDYETLRERLRGINR